MEKLTERLMKMEMQKQMDSLKVKQNHPTHIQKFHQL
jgi:hypothetical protein